MHPQAMIENQSMQMSLLEDTHANHSVEPGSDVARQMTAISGLKCIELLKLSGRDGLLPRMFMDTSQWASTKCYLTWKALTTPGGRLLFQLAPSMPRTDEIESGLLPTPRAVEVIEHPMKQAHRLKDRTGNRPNNLQSMARFNLWPTPRANKIGGYSSPNFSPTLEQEVKSCRLWPTPVLSMYKGSSPNSLTRKSGKSRVNDRLDHAVMDSDGGQLNPQWVEWLMGYPEGWLS